MPEFLRELESLGMVKIVTEDKAQGVYLSLPEGF